MKSSVSLWANVGRVLGQVAIGQIRSADLRYQLRARPEMAPPRPFGGTHSPPAQGKQVGSPVSQCKNLRPVRRLLPTSARPESALGRFHLPLRCRRSDAPIVRGVACPAHRVEESRMYQDAHGDTPPPTVAANHRDRMLLDA